jgi:hypothetical protein
MWSNSVIGPLWAGWELVAISGYHYFVAILFLRCLGFSYRYINIEVLDIERYQVMIFMYL